MKESARFSNESWYDGVGQVIKLPIFLNDQEMKICRFSTSWVEASPPRIPVTTRFLTCFFFGIPNGKPIICHDCIMGGATRIPRETWQCQPCSQVHAEFLGASVATACAIHAKASLRTFTLIFGVCLMGKNWHKICTRKIRNKNLWKMNRLQICHRKLAFL